MTEESLPEIHNSILPWGDRTDRTGDVPKVRVGGWLDSPELARSYLLAARRLIWPVGPGDGAQLGVVSFPIVFLQRHAYELALKDLIHGAYQVEHGRRRLAALRADGPKAAVNPQKQPAFKHEFKVILDELERALVEIEFPVEGISDEMREMAHRLTAIEEGQHTRPRYGEFAKPKDLELGRVQRDLEDLYQREFWARDYSDLYDRDTLYALLGAEAHSIDQETYELEAKYGMR